MRLFGYWRPQNASEWKEPPRQLWDMLSDINSGTSRQLGSSPTNRFSPRFLPSSYQISRHNARTYRYFKRLFRQMDGEIATWKLFLDKSLQQTDCDKVESENSRTEFRVDALLQIFETSDRLKTRNCSQRDFYTNLWQFWTCFGGGTYITSRAVFSANSRKRLPSSWFSAKLIVWSIFICLNHDGSGPYNRFPCRILHNQHRSRQNRARTNSVMRAIGR